MDGMPWAALQEPKQNGLNLLRSRAKPPLSPLTRDPPSRDLETVIGKGHDLRAANATRAESAARPGLSRTGFELTVSRDSRQYNAVLDELAKAPLVGKNKGAADRAIVADAVFAKSSSKPTLMTGDANMITRLFERFGPGRSGPIKQNHKESVVDAIVRLYPAGFDAELPDGIGGTRVITVIPMR